MGMRIFETSGNFNPADYGLLAGDVVDVICVGGGQAGGGGPGETIVDAGESSFGSYVSSSSGAIMGRGEQLSAGGACGAGGYLPGVPFYGGNGGLPIGLAGTHQTPVSPYCNPDGPGNKGAGGGSASGNRGAGGNGYGAGGGGSYNASGSFGGDAGRIAFGSAVLADSNAVTVTVGFGGTGGMFDGAPGVVIVFW